MNQKDAQNPSAGDPADPAERTAEGTPEPGGDSVAPGADGEIAPGEGGEEADVETSEAEEFLAEVSPAAGPPQADAATAVHSGGAAFRPFDSAPLPDVSYDLRLEPLERTETANRPDAVSFFASSLDGAAAPPDVDPNFTPSDPLFSQQWHLREINVTSVWDDFTGAGVVIGIIDDGVAYTHPDLAANYDTAIDYDARDHDNDANASAADDRHGTTVAGTIAAVQGNGTGVVGVAYEATITGFRMGFGSNGSTAQTADNLKHALGVDVVNNSWGYVGFFSDNFNSSSFTASANAVQNAAANGRGGLGTIIVFSAGNSRADGDNTNHHNFQNSKYIISVAATDSSGHYASFSTPGASVLLSAPGVGITTTDRVGALGYSSGSYVSVSGTSFSAPIVSGVAALMLDANPELGYRDVQEILAYSSTKTNPTNSRWMTNDAVNWNGGGLHFSPDYGFGLVDAHGAARLAEFWTAQSTVANMLVASASRSTSAAIPDNNATGISQTVTIAPGLLIDRVEVDLNISHSWIGDLKVTLVAPDGTQSVLINRPGINPDTNAGTGADQNNISNFKLSSNQFWGETSGGQWTLVVSDNNGGQTGTLNNWTLRVYGDAAGNDQNYIYTDEYAGMTGAANAARRLLTDADGGTDTLNAAAVTGASNIDLTPGASSTISGNTLTIAAGTVIENVISGDGNDTITGNFANNLLIGGRGKDNISGGDGNDTLAGHFGNDTLAGGNGTDTALYYGFYADFLITYVNATQATVKDLVISDGDEGTDTLTSIEFLQFADLLYLFNTPPVAVTDNAVTNEDNAVVVNVLANDNDPDGDGLVVSAVTNGAHGGVAINPGNTSVTYTPQANYNGADNFTYTVGDGKGGTATATVNVTVNPVNDAPAAADDSAAILQELPITIDVLNNDVDVDGDTLSVTGAGNPAHGAVAVNPDGTITYTPDAGYYGDDGFTYSISDGHGGTGNASVALTVLPLAPPVTLIDETFAGRPAGFLYVDDAFGTDQPRYAAGGWKRRSGFTDGALALTLGRGTAQGIENMSGGFEQGFTLDRSSGVTLTFRYDLSQTAHYEAGEFSQILVALDGTLFGLNGQDYIDQITGDGNGGPVITTGWQLVTIDLGVLNTGAHTLVLGGFNNFSDARNELTTILFDDISLVAVSDGVELDVVPGNTAPVAGDDAAIGIQDSALIIDVLANDSDPENDSLSLAGITAPAHGTAVINLDGTITYTPANGYSGTDSFDYVLWDGFDGYAQANVDVTLTPLPVVLIEDDFKSRNTEFTYIDDAFLGTDQARYESGSRVGTGGGALRLRLGGVDNNAIDDMSGGFAHGFNLSESTAVKLTFDYNLTLAKNYEPDEFGQVLVRIDGTLYGADGEDYVAQLAGDGDGGLNMTTGWQTVTLDIGALAAGAHTLVIGGYNNAKDHRSETTTILFDNVNLSTDPVAALASSLADSSPDALPDTGPGGALSLFDVLDDSDLPAAADDPGSAGPVPFAAVAPELLSSLIADDAALAAMQAAA